MSLLIKSNKSSSHKSISSGRYTTAEEAALAKNADLVAKLKKMNLQIVNGQPVTKPGNRD